MSEREMEIPEPRPPKEVVDTLVEHHRTFLAFLEKRVGSRAVAEDILQEAFVKSVERGGTLREDESAVAWFYRMLRNAVTDHYRRDAAGKRKIDALVRELDTSERSEDALHGAVCRCVTGLAATLKPEYADALARIEVDGTSVKAYAETTGITPGNAAVRVFRARDALRKQVARACGTCADHGCLDCTCDGAKHRGGH